jgi:RNA recognition motif-containing protein
MKRKILYFFFLAKMSNSRICVKNLPKHLKHDRFKTLFSSQGGTVTDVKLVLKDGVSRRIGFVGYKTDEEAAAAVKYFNKTYIDTSRIIVEISVQANSSELERPWSKYSANSSANNRLNPMNDVGEEVESKSRGAPAAVPAVVDPKLDEFLSVVGGMKKTWGNDDMTSSAQVCSLKNNCYRKWLLGTLLLLLRPWRKRFQMKNTFVARLNRELAARRKKWKLKVLQMH